MKSQFRHRGIEMLTACAMALMACACGSRTAQSPGVSQAAGSKAPVQLDISDLAVGNGEAIVAGETAVVHYTGWVYDPGAAEQKGTKFDSSRDRGQPFRFPVGKGQVIQGWDQGVVGMKVGGQRRLLVPASLGYGERGAGGVIPPDAALVFDIELLAIEK